MSKNNNNINIVYMCGGSGERLWPLSSKENPKQFMEINGSSLLEKTIERNLFISKKFKNFHNYFVTNEIHRFLTKNSLENISKTFINNSSILLEPLSKNTATSLTLAAFDAYSKDQNSIIIAVPADQIISDTYIYQEKIMKSIDFAVKDQITLLGVKPLDKNPNFGYIRKKGPKSTFVKEFIEKPSRSKLTKIFNTNEYLWNCGIFILKSKKWLDLMKLHQENLFKTLEMIFKQKRFDNFFTRYDPIMFGKLKKISIDYAVMEKLHDSEQVLRVLKISDKWSDLGTVDSLKKQFKHTGSNVNLSSGQLYNSKNNFISKSNKKIFLNNVNNLFVLQDNDNILISDAKNHNIRNVLTKISRYQSLNQTESFNKVFRPWGYYQTISIGENFKVKKIIIKPKSSISLQLHKYRSEHWVVVKGKASIINGEKKIILKIGESTFIPKKTAHRVTNDMSEDLIIIETQVGNYLKEDDIFRYEDLYGRT
jgi:mannose-1-phosphate guanylyltransferase/mannose-6-phosphate isomerase